MQTGTLNRGGCSSACWSRRPPDRTAGPRQAQIAKLDRFLSLQRRNHAILKEELSSIPGISFRRIPDPSGDSCTFLSWFLPTEDVTRAAIAEMKAAGILPAPLREIVIDRALAAPEAPVPLSCTKIIALMVLWSQEAEIDNLVLDELLDDEGGRRLH